jgi:hypothetical protein
MSGRFLFYNIDMTYIDVECENPKRREKREREANSLYAQRYGHIPNVPTRHGSSIGDRVRSDFLDKSVEASNPLMLSIAYPAYKRQQNRMRVKL